MLVAGPNAIFRAPRFSGWTFAAATDLTLPAEQASGKCPSDTASERLYGDADEEEGSHAGGSGMGRQWVGFRPT